MPHLSENMFSRLQCCFRRVSRGGQAHTGQAHTGFVAGRRPAHPSASGFVLYRSRHLSIVLDDGLEYR